MDTNAEKIKQGSRCSPSEEALSRFRRNASAVLAAGLILVLGGPALALYEMWLPGETTSVFWEFLPAGAFGIVSFSAGLGLRWKTEWGRKLALVAIVLAAVALLGLLVEDLAQAPGLVELSRYLGWKERLAIWGGCVAAPLVVVASTVWLLAKAARYFRREDVKRICRSEAR